MRKLQDAGWLPSEREMVEAGADVDPVHDPTAPVVLMMHADAPRRAPPTPDSDGRLRHAAQHGHDEAAQQIEALKARHAELLEASKMADRLSEQAERMQNKLDIGARRAGLADESASLLPTVTEEDDMAESGTASPGQQSKDRQLQHE